MTEYEVADYASSMMSNFLSAITIYFSVVTTYVVVAFVAGDRLTRLQLAVVNLSFTVAAGIMGLLSVLIFARFFAFATQVGNPDGAVGPLNFTIPLAILVILVLTGCYTFMWSVRSELNDN